MALKVGDEFVLLSREAAGRAGYREQSFSWRRMHGLGPPYHELGNQVVYLQSELDAWLAAGGARGEQYRTKRAAEQERRAQARASNA